MQPEMNVGDLVVATAAIGDEAPLSNTSPSPFPQLQIPWLFMPS